VHPRTARARRGELIAAAGEVAGGAEPFTNWLPDPVRRDPWGYVLTGPDLAQHWTMTRAPFLVETSLPGVFAVGDVGHGSVKRVASAVGEGSICIRLVHEYLALTP
jgi:thioredoxin reductase (NADPH)